MSQTLSDCHIIFVLGGPGAGKGTMCQLLVSEFGYGHYSAGELLRSECESGSETGNSIKEMLREGQIVPSHITIGLLRKSIENHQGSKKFLIDGFPRNIDQGRIFEETVKPCDFVLFLDVPEEIMQRRLLGRADQSGRDDDNLETIQKRFRTHRETCLPVVDHYDALNKVVRINSNRPKEEVYEDVKAAISSRAQ
eukprot:CAMPEP_0184350508 /NCGR_PEP_ID=MMETSP1089-20130417/38217_1 /TAXON_ID=38269 ORGANISM="Gloeochaete wittrockiana, Strain SAG46.84" /NCGR_SAMPLE_ID=MMETSP1089 /ASSEMBLY_ACC=CAM_ASM_000445 /LENGTH=194 /DNA_ID=CAMNT_0026683277 /DNA_START=14 /DNA_END=601 /DNA_ORIENTATION=-